MTSWTRTCITPVSTPAWCVKSQLPGGSRPRLAILMGAVAPRNLCRNILFVFILNIYSLAASSRRCSAQLLIQKSSLLIGVLYRSTKSK